MTDETATDETATGDAPGLDLPRLATWFAEHIPGSGGPLRADLLVGGKSNLTYVVTDGTAEWVVRRPPLGHVLATAHDMAREYRVMTALGDTEVPVPATYGFCDDVSVVGAPFTVMELVRGVPYRRAAELERLGAARTRDIALTLIDTLGALHLVDPGRVGLADFGRPEGYLARQVARWKKQLDASHSRDLPAADELHARLAANIPAESAAGVVHGDYRLDNVLIGEDDRLTAVLDWEMATLGDPLSDLALMAVYGRIGAVSGKAGKAAKATVSDVTRAPGYPAEDDLFERYAQITGRDLTSLGFHLALAAFKLAAILEGIHYRHLHSQTVGEGFDHIGDGIHLLLDVGLDQLKEKN